MLIETDEDNDVLQQPSLSGKVSAFLSNSEPGLAFNYLFHCEFLYFENLMTI